MRFDFPRVQRTLGGEDLSRWDASRLKQKGAHAGEVTEIIDRMGMASATVRTPPPLCTSAHECQQGAIPASMSQTHDRVTPYTHGCLSRVTPFIVRPIHVS